MLLDVTGFARSNILCKQIVVYENLHKYSRVLPKVKDLLCESASFQDILQRLMW